MLLFSDVLYMLVRYASPSRSMCLRFLMLTLSGHVELLLLLYFIAAWTCVVVSVMLVVCSLSVFISMCLFVCVLVNCLLNAFAICVGEVNVFSLKVIVLCCFLLFKKSSKECMCCVCDPSVCLGVPSICQNCVFV